MSYRPTPVALAVALAMLGAAAPAVAAEGTTATAAADQITVTGIRASKQKSLLRKRNADTVTEVATAEDIGKMPDKNVADTLQKLPGVSTITGSGGQGGYDENDRVSLRGTSPSLALTTVNGHGVATADWDPADQVAGGAGTSTSGAARSVSYLLFPSEIVSQVVVHKSPQADQAEGGISGSVDIVTRRPLEFRQQLTLDANLQAVYSDFAKKTDPQLSALFNWKNEANSFGVMVQAFSQQRHIRRDSEAEINWARVGANTAAGQANGGQLANKLFIHSAVDTLFQQERKRSGGMIGLQARPTDALSLNFDAFYSKLDASYTANRLVLRPNNSLNGGVVPTDVTVEGDLITAATFANSGNAMGAQLETQANPKASSQTKYFNGEFKYDISDKLALAGQLGRTEATGESYLYWNYIFLPNVTTAYKFNGMDTPVSFSLPNGVNAASFSALPGNSGADNSFSLQRSEDSETYGKLDLEYKPGSGLLAALKAGIRQTAHEREGSRPMKGSAPINADRTGSVTLTTIPGWNGATFPGNFGSSLGGVGSAGASTPYISSDAVVAWSDANFSNDPAYNLPVAGVFKVKEDTSAAYAMAKFASDNWRGDFGLRYVKTEVSVRTNRGVPCGVPQNDPAKPNYNPIAFGSQAQVDQCVAGNFVPAGATLFTGSRFGNFIQFTTESDYQEWLPSANIAWDATPDLVLRAGAAKVLSRPDYSALGATVGLGYNTALNPPSTGSGGNPELGPNLAYNYNLGAEWYFTKQSLLSAQLFLLDFKSLVSSGTTLQRLFNPAVPASAGGPQVMDTLVTAPVMVTGRSQGIELGYQQELGYGFGVQANYAYTDAEETSGQNNGQPMLGSSRDTYTLGGYFENETFSARLTYSHRSKMRTGLYGGSQNYLAPTGTLSAALNYTVSPNLTLSFEGLNLNDPKLRYYNAPTATVPFEATTGFYNSGRQYYLGLRYKY
ncbi:TonB-dependent receptor [Chitinimonas koreensis]|uniref:TonB-dependent receptor n=1 Tax=Chitinimonas koreensis TaxID=356302 RepID=UPI00048CA3AC|nr:TonB-dependent receptor [Chitinimonas koreensis]QNM98786.1 TonB-dependent receptor [Chitinimonas koreensis]